MMHKNKMALEVEEYIRELKGLHEYARKNGFSDAADSFKTILIIFTEDAIKPEKAKTAIIQAKEKAASSKAEIFNVLRQQKNNNCQIVFEAMKDFFSPHNKFEKFISSIEKHVKIQSRFFSSKPVVSSVSNVNISQKSPGIKPKK